MTPRIVLALAVLSVACASTPQPVPEPVVTSGPESVTDPRVSELRILVMELLDRMEVLQARVDRMDDVITELANVRTGGKGTANQDQHRREDESAAVERYAAASDAAEAYREALILFGRGRNDDARKRFEEVYRADPMGELADNALFWIAETHFVMNDFRSAVRIYDRLLQDFPSQNKAPDALYRKALALAKLGDLSLARQTLELVIERYPYSPAASSAKQELERIRY